MIFLVFAGLLAGAGVHANPARFLPSCLRLSALEDASCPCDTKWCQTKAQEISDQLMEGMTPICMPIFNAGLCYRMITRADEDLCGCCLIEDRLLCSEDERSLSDEKSVEITPYELRASGGLPCGVHLISSTEYFISPGYPDEKYPNKYYCWRRFLAPSPEHTVVVRCEKIYIKYDGTCRYDYLLFQDYYKLNERLCGLLYNVKLMSETGRMDVIFDTNRRRGTEGFNCTVEAVEVPCPAPYVKLESECLYLALIELIFDDARTYCIGTGGDLASPSNVPFLKQHVVDSGVTTAVWLGASDREIEGVWNWFDGSPVKSEDWFANAPNNGFGLEHCMVLKPDVDPPLNDAECDRPKYFVCEYQLLKG